MLSYQHGYHAGNAADLHKHAILALLLEALRQKRRALSYFDTHSGRGVYDLKSDFAQKTQEQQTGIANYQGGIAPYDAALNWTAQQFGADHYPGSAAIICSQLQEGDQLHLAELHPKEGAELQKNIGNRANVYLGDGFEILCKKVRLKPARGLVFIDPSFERKEEYDELPRHVSKILEKWPIMTIAIWYPILEAELHKTLEAKLCPLGRIIFRADFLPSKLRMKGSAIMVLNAPHRADKTISKEIDKLAPFYMRLKTELRT